MTLFLSLSLSSSVILIFYFFFLFGIFILFSSESYMRFVEYRQTIRVIIKLCLKLTSMKFRENEEFS